jgi:hypothetical protein
MIRPGDVVVVLALALGCSCGGYDNQLLDRSRGFGGERVADVSVADVPVNGFPVVVVVEHGPNLEGELLAVDDERVFVLRDRGKSPASVRWAQVREVRVEVAPSRPGEPGGSVAWTVVGTLSTLSHGEFLILSFPIWLASGVPVSWEHGQPLEARVTSAQFRDMLYQFARHPQGPPPYLSARPIPPPPRASASPSPAIADGGAADADADIDAGETIER